MRSFINYAINNITFKDDEVCMACFMQRRNRKEYGTLRGQAEGTRPFIIIRYIWEVNKAVLLSHTGVKGERI
jgi:hypothetical protein